MPEQVQAVVAGSKAFLDALDAHLRLRLGTAPLRARSPVEAMKACAGDGGLLVLEYGGPDWLEAVKSLRTVRDHAALPIVAAVPGSRMAELGALQRAGVDETVRWDARVDPVLWAVDRLVAARPRAAAKANAGGAVAQASADGMAPRASVDSTRDASVHGAAAGAPARGRSERADGCPRAARAGPEVALELHEVVPVTPPAAAADALLPLPDELPSDEEIARLLRAALAREVSPDEAWRPFTERLASQLGDMERVALSGAPFPLDAAPLRAAACLRWRIAAVLARARATGAPPDPDVAGALPVEADAALTALKALAEAAGAELQPGIDAARNALVREAIGFTDAIAAALAPAEAQPAAPLVEKRSGARVITNEGAETTARRRPVALGVALAAALAIAAGYHVNRLYSRPGPPRADFPGAPANTIGAERDGAKVFSVLPGKAIDPAELERLRVAERSKGNVMREVAPGTYVIAPEAAKARGGNHP